MKKTNPLVLWIILWVLGFLFITIKNRIVNGTALVLGELISANLVADIILIPTAFIGYFIIKLIIDGIGYKHFFEKEKGLKNVTLVWLVIFVLIFLFPLFRK